MMRFFISAILCCLFSVAFAAPDQCPKQLSTCAGLDPFWQLCFTPDANPKTLTRVITNKIAPGEGMQVECLYDPEPYPIFPIHFMANANAKIKLTYPQAWKEVFVKPNTAYVCDAAFGDCSFTMI